MKYGHYKSNNVTQSKIQLKTIKDIYRINLVKWDDSSSKT